MAPKVDSNFLAGTCFKSASTTPEKLVCLCEFFYFVYNNFIVKFTNVCQLF